MSTLTRAAVAITLWILISAAWFALTVACLAMLAGCAASSYQQQAAAEVAIEGTYIEGLGCKRLRTATGNAAVSAAKSDRQRQVEVKR